MPIFLDFGDRNGQSSALKRKMTHWQIAETHCAGSTGRTSQARVLLVEASASQAFGAALYRPGSNVNGAG
jgi:hypothetical protein